MHRRAVIVALLISALAGGATALAGPLRATQGPDHLVGTSAADRINGRGGDDEVRGGPGNDLLKGGAGADTVAGDAGNDVIIGGPDPICCLAEPVRTGSTPPAARMTSSPAATAAT